MLTAETIEDIIQHRIDQVILNSKKEFPDHKIEYECPHDNTPFDKLYVRVEFIKEDNLSDYTREDLIEICKQQLIEFYKLIYKIKTAAPVTRCQDTLEVELYSVIDPLKGVRSCLWDKDPKWTAEYNKAITGK